MTTLGTSHTTVSFKDEQFELFIHPFTNECSLRVAVFSDQGYIPPSVLQAALNPPTDLVQWNSFNIKIDKQVGVVFLEWELTLDELKSSHWDSELENFYINVQIWKELLDEKGRNDLVYIPVS
jgi:hypothetical protein